jgi:hypothetical protein
MSDFDANRTFRGLPLTSEQDAEVRHYIKKKKQRGEPWDTPELEAMLQDMLEPPADEDGVVDDDTEDETRSAAETRPRIQASPLDQKGGSDGRADDQPDGGSHSGAMRRGGSRDASPAPAYPRSEGALAGYASAARLAAQALSVQCNVN